MRRILVADDGSDSALCAVELAAELAGQMGAELFALAVFDSKVFDAGQLAVFARSEGMDVAAAQEATLQSATAYLDRCRDIAAAQGVARCRVAREAGTDPAQIIIDFAHEHDIDLIVVGSRGYSQLPGLLLGSVSQELASHAPCSVLIAR